MMLLFLSAKVMFSEVLEGGENMGVMTNVGGGGGGNIRYNAVTDMIQVKVNGSWVDTPYKAYGTFNGMLYNAGVQAVPWDNTGYPASYDTEAAGYEGAVLSSDSFTFNLAAANGVNGILTNDKIDCSGFTSLKATIGGTTYTLNISQYTSEPAYIVIYEYANASEWGLYMTLASTKQYYNNNKIVGTHWEDLPTASRSTPIPSITKVWLE